MLVISCFVLIQIWLGLESLSLCVRRWLLKPLCARKVLVQCGRDGGCCRRLRHSAFPVLPAFLSCNNPVGFMVLCATSTYRCLPLWSVHSCLFPWVVADAKGFQWHFESVFEVLLLASKGVFAMSEFAKTRVSWGADGPPCELHGLPSVAGSASRWSGCWKGWLGWKPLVSRVGKIPDFRHK